MLHDIWRLVNIGEKYPVLYIHLSTFLDSIQWTPDLNLDCQSHLYFSL